MTISSRKSLTDGDADGENSSVAWRWRSLCRLFWIIFTVAALIRFAVYLPEPDMALTGDEHAYVRGGEAALHLTWDLVRGEDTDDTQVAAFYGRGWHPPLGKLVAGVPAALGGIPLARLLQVLLSCALVPLGYWLILHLAGRRAALVGMALIGLNPSLVGFSHLLWTENLYLLLSTLFLIGALRLMRSECPPSRRLLGGGGVLIGLLLLLKPAFLPVLLACSVFAILLGRRRQMIARTAIAVGVIGLVISMLWDLMLWRQEGRYIHGSTATQIHMLAKYNHRGLKSWTHAWDWAQQEATAQNRYFADVARDAWREDFAATPATGIVARIVDDALKQHLFELYFLEKQLREGIHWLSEHPAPASWLLLFEFCFRTALIFFGLAGLLIGTMDKRARWLCAAFLVGNMAIVLVGVPNPRHNLMIMVPLTIGVIALIRRIHQERRHAEVAVATIGIVALGIGLFARLPAMPWSYRFIDPLTNAGRAAGPASDTVQVRMSGQCQEAFIQLGENLPGRVIVNGRAYPTDRRRPINVSNRIGGTIRYVRGLNADASQLPLSTSQGESSVMLDTASREWTPLVGNECFEYRWRGS